MLVPVCTSTLYRYPGSGANLWSPKGQGLRRSLCLIDSYKEKKSCTLIKVDKEKKRKEDVKKIRSRH